MKPQYTPEERAWGRRQRLGNVLQEQACRAGCTVLSEHNYIHDVVLIIIIVM